MKRSTLIKIGSAGALAAGLLVAPAALAPATTAYAEETTPSSPTTPSEGTAPTDSAAGMCSVTDGTLNWGVKESFRSYITTPLAGGDWQATDGASYETPNFSWTGATGEINESTGAGNVSFTGTVTFTAHGGVLNLVLANPTVQIGDDGSALLLVDATSNDMNGDLVLDVVQGELASLGVPGPVSAVSGSVEYLGVPATVTEAGVPAFGSMYAAGTPLDPIDLTFTLDCAPAEAAEPPADEVEVTDEDIVAVPISAPVDEAEMPWVPIIIGAAVVVVAAVVVGIVVASRRKRGGSAQPDPATKPEDGSDPGTSAEG